MIYYTMIYYTMQSCEIFNVDMLEMSAKHLGNSTQSEHK